MEMLASSGQTEVAAGHRPAVRLIMDNAAVTPAIPRSLRRIAAL